MYTIRRCWRPTHPNENMWHIYRNACFTIIAATATTVDTFKSMAVVRNHPWSKDNDHIARHTTTRSKAHRKWKPAAAVDHSAWRHRAWTF